MVDKIKQKTSNIVDSVAVIVMSRFLNVVGIPLILFLLSQFFGEIKETVKVVHELSTIVRLQDYKVESATLLLSNHDRRIRLLEINCNGCTKSDRPEDTAAR
jgi:hypothetical protein